MTRAMILSVGTGTRADVDIAKPLVKTVRDSDPALIFFLVSTESQKHAEEAARRLNLPKDKFQCISVSSSDDVQQSFVTSLEALRQIRAKGYDPDDIIVDFTTGTKAMTAGLALAAVAFRTGTLKYIFGSRKDGVVEDGTEKFLSVSPNSILAVYEIELAKQLMMQLRFEAAKQILMVVNEALLTQHDRELKENLQLLAGAYSKWDHFDHIVFCGEYSKVKWGKRELEPFKLKSLMPHDRLIPLAKDLKNGNITADALADLWNNAVRRRREGRFDDSVARFYRLTEMLAQYILRSRYEVDTAKVLPSNKNLAKLNQAALERLQRRMDPSDGHIKIGVKDAYWLLEELDDPLGKKFNSSNKLRGLLNDRNKSILAHGTKPITREICESLSLEVMQLLKEADGDFDLKSQQFQFPWL